MASSTGQASAEQVALSRFRQLVPALGGNFKGAHGKVAIVGGCLEFTGAPFFAAMSALRVGADMAYVICTPSASTAIKCYSPELMVLPYLPEQPPGSEEGPVHKAAVDRAVSRITPWLSRATAVVVGPGLGGDPAVCATATALMGEARRLGLPLLVDGSALTHIVAQDASVVSGYRSCVLTPNVAELGRIAAAVGLQLPGRMSDKWLEHAPAVARAFKGPVVVAKGEKDLICGPEPAGVEPAAAPAPAAAQGPQAGAGAAEPLRPLLTCTDPGSLRRCGGQGDVLAGTAAAFLGWAAKHRTHQASSPSAAATTVPPTASSSLSSPASQPAAGGSITGAGIAGAAPVAGTGSGPGLDTDTVAACAFMACRVMRGAASEAFAVGERSMVAGDIIPHLHTTFKRVVEAEGAGGRLGRKEQLVIVGSCQDQVRR